MERLYGPTHFDTRCHRYCDQHSVDVQCLPRCPGIVVHEEEELRLLPGEGEDLLDDTAPEADGQRLLRRGTNAPADRCRRSAIFAAAFTIFAAAGAHKPRKIR